MGSVDTTCLCQWLFVVGEQGLDRDTWKFKPESSEPKIEEGMMVHGRNAKRLAELLAMVEAQKGKLKQLTACPESPCGRTSQAPSKKMCRCAQISS